MSLGQNIRIKREKAGLSQVELANKVGVTQSMINQVEKDIKVPNVYIGYDIAKHLNTTVEDLLS